VLRREGEKKKFKEILDLWPEPFFGFFSSNVFFFFFFSSIRKKMLAQLAEVIVQIYFFSLRLSLLLNKLVHIILNTTFQEETL
jgi:hypothetical protein